MLFSLEKPLEVVALLSLATIDTSLERDEGSQDSNEANGSTVGTTFGEIGASRSLSGNCGG